MPAPNQQRLGLRALAINHENSLFIRMLLQKVFEMRYWLNEHIVLSPQKADWWLPFSLETNHESYTLVTMFVTKTPSFDLDLTWPSNL